MGFTDLRIALFSGNYNYKMGVGKVRKMGESPYKHQFRSMSFARRDIA